MATRLKTMAAASGLIIVMFGMLPRLQNDVVLNSQNDTAVYNATEALGNSAIQLSPYLMLVLAAGFGLVVLRGL